MNSTVPDPAGNPDRLPDLLADGVLVDTDETGSVVGVEILDAVQVEVDGQPVYPTPVSTSDEDVKMLRRREPAASWINIVFIRCASGVLEFVGVEDGNGSPINVSEWVDHYTGDPEYRVLRIGAPAVPVEPTDETVERVDEVMRRVGSSLGANWTGHFRDHRYALIRAALDAMKETR